MKIKMDFITNSSSTAYVVFIPDDFGINNINHTSKDFDECMESFTDYYCGDHDCWDEQNIPEVKNKIKAEYLELLSKFIKEMKTSPEIYFGWCAYNDYHRISFISALFKDYIIVEAETGADYPDQIININSKNDSMEEKRKVLKQLLKKGKENEN